MLGQAPPQTAQAAIHIKDSSDAAFLADVIEASKVQPVIVDFWATWCGPCRQLGPALEKAVGEAGGKVKLVKIDVDKNPAYAGQLRVQSIPTVYAFIDGKPVDGFMGALPDSQLKAFIDKQIAAAGGADGAPGEDLGGGIEAMLEMGAESLALGDLGGAAQAFAAALQIDPENIKAIAGLARCYLGGGDAERAQEVVDMAPPGAKDADLDSVRAALKLASAAPSQTADLDARLAADPKDHQARFDLAAAQAGGGHMDEAIDNLLKIIEAERDWNEDAARKQLLTVFEAAGSASPAVKLGRRRLSTLLFS